MNAKDSKSDGSVDYNVHARRGMRNSLPVRTSSEQEENGMRHGEKQRKNLQNNSNVDYEYCPCKYTRTDKKLWKSQWSSAVHGRRFSKGAQMGK